LGSFLGREIQSGRHGGISGRSRRSQEDEKVRLPLRAGSKREIAEAGRGKRGLLEPLLGFALHVAKAKKWR